MSRTPLDRLALVLVIIGALNWLLMGIFSYDLVAAIFGGNNTFLSRTIYTLVGLAGLYCISLLFRESEPARDTQ
ncbi:DUF378 domain-containing protein [Clostridium thermosuccinogenes]|jgi:uncharacterized membrane protein YuzA (DUF378 family)|uniref:DUF378 domain-containing protein n=1 Tax=Clostridium thermosuccinogenes TaxID=84032 RepID=A0A2K2FIK6_9CLOT|nr:DUF378 domain-containing protein [Pseudoclostridium thermosuccinogenes]AUS95222.1 DUF378 domain-containing protein [Pseudoclostridium thermosuccinogenes]PNT91600.1 DUF378 domain-containing protein [Pseudoclostridium thermosuccinogenes]PNT96780.1 DUF378 domain-containing protein [Pseudoclostridium thermosuccinogenes]PNT98617.1 DUF378 domain-containing protein [Pseudoclostridium thermosuccinogenes]